MAFKTKKGDFLFYLGWIILTLNTIITQSYLEMYANRIFTIIGIGLLLTKIFLSSKIKKKNLIAIILFLILGVISFYVTKDKRMLWLAIALSSFEKENFYKVAKLTAWLMLCATCLIVCSCVLIYGNVGESLKGGMALGMGHPNILHCTVELIVALFLFVYWNKIKLKHIILMFVANKILYCFTWSRTGFFTLLGILLLVFWLKLKEKYIKAEVIYLMSILLIIIFTVLPFLYSIYPQERIIQTIDNMMTGRLWQSVWYLNISGVRLFGNYYSELYSSKPFALLDMGFFRLLAEYGVVIYLLIVIGYILSMRQCVKYRNYGLLFLYVSMIIITCTESLGTYVFFNVAFLGFGNLIYDYNFKEAIKHIKRKREGQSFEEINNIYTNLQ